MAHDERNNEEENESVVVGGGGRRRRRRRRRRRMRGSNKAHCAGDVYLMNNNTRSALLGAMRGRRYWDLEPHLVTGEVAREGTRIRIRGPTCRFLKLL